MENACASLSSPVSRHAIVPNLRLAQFRSSYRTVDFDGFIRTLYSLPLYSWDLKSLIISATRAEDRHARRENYEKRDHRKSREKGRQRLMSAKAYVGPVINLRKRASYLESCATPRALYF